MFFKFLALAAIFLVCEATIPDRLYYRRAPLRFIFNQQGMRRPNTWNYQIVNGRPVISGFPNPNAYVAFGLNPQTGQIEQTQIITQTRPGGPFINMIQNMLHVAGQFFGQVTGAFGNAVGGALQTAGQFGQEIQDLTNPVISVTGISQPVAEKEPVQQPVQQPVQPVTEGMVRPPITPSVETPSQPSIETPSEPSLETAEGQAKSDLQTALSAVDQAIISFQTLRTNVQANFQNYFESTEGENALEKINENINWAVSKLQSIRENAVSDSVNVLLTGRNTVSTAFDNIENTLVGVAGIQGRDFLTPTRNELNKTFNDALSEYQEINAVENTVTEISSDA